LAQLATVNPQYDLARRQTDQLNKLQAELNDAQADAELITYLRHPWPRTRLLEELLRPLPEEITLTSLQIDQQEPAVGSRPGRLVPLEDRQKEPAAEQPASVADLKQLRGERDQARTIITLEGITSDSSALHHYLSQLNDASLFSNAELESFQVEQIEETGKVLRFVAKLEVEPGRGQLR
jgi:Tfp pilus assembly protein PilN